MWFWHRFDLRHLTGYVTLYYITLHYIHLISFLFTLALMTTNILSFMYADLSLSSEGCAYVIPRSNAKQDKSVFYPTKRAV